VSKAPYSGIVTFGASLSDSGNGFALLGDQSVPPAFQVDALLVPFSPYARGGHHLTNGATWVEQFAQSIGLARSANPAWRGNSPGATNYAIGSARAYLDRPIVDLSSQVATFLAEHGGQAPADALYVIEMGSNDVRDALLVFPQNPVLAGQILQAGVATIAESIATLYAAGAQHFLVWNVPDISLTPAVLALDAQVPGTAFVASLLTQGFNAGLEGALGPLDLLAGLEIHRLDVFSLVHAVVAAPATFGFLDVTTACITPGVAPFTCQQPDDYFFWDGIHPTEAAHGILAIEAAKELGLD
jgi:phospholipase/lecithinase/hemolysin